MGMKLMCLALHSRKDPARFPEQPSPSLTSLGSVRPVGKAGPTRGGGFSEDKESQYRRVLGEGWNFLLCALFAPGKTCVLV